MFAQRSSPVVAVVIALALAAAVLVIATQVNSVRSSTTVQQVRRVSTPAALTVHTDTKSNYRSRSCWRRKFGCPARSRKIP